MLLSEATIRKAPKDLALDPIENMLAVPPGTFVLIRATMEDKNGEKPYVIGQRLPNRPEEDVNTMGVRVFPLWEELPTISEEDRVVQEAIDHDLVKEMRFNATEPYLGVNIVWQIVGWYARTGAQMAAFDMSNLGKRLKLGKFNMNTESGINTGRALDERIFTGRFEGEDNIPYKFPRTIDYETGPYGFAKEPRFEIKPFSPEEVEIAIRSLYAISPTESGFHPFRVDIRPPEHKAAKEDHDDIVEQIKARENKLRIEWQYIDAMNNSQPAQPEPLPEPWTVGLKAEADAVKELCDRYGYGAVMSWASAFWRKHFRNRNLPPSGVHTAIPMGLLPQDEQDRKRVQDKPMDEAVDALYANDVEEYQEKKEAFFTKLKKAFENPTNQNARPLVFQHPHTEPQDNITTKTLPGVFTFHDMVRDNWLPVSGLQTIAQSFEMIVKNTYPDSGEETFQAAVWDAEQQVIHYGEFPDPDLDGVVQYFIPLEKVEGIVFTPDQVAIIWHNDGSEAGIKDITMTVDSLPVPPVEEEPEYEEMDLDQIEQYIDKDLDFSYDIEQHEAVRDAEQQLTGYLSPNLQDLVRSMGLTIETWSNIDPSVKNRFSPEDQEEIVRILTNDSQL